MSTYDFGGRVLTTVRCRVRRHVLARVVIRASDHHRVVLVPRWAVVDKDVKRPGRARVRSDLGGGEIDLDDTDDDTRMDSRHVACACNNDFSLFPSDLLPSPRMEVRGGIRYRVEGEFEPAADLILLDPMRGRGASR